MLDVNGTQTSAVRTNKIAKELLQLMCHAEREVWSHEASSYLLDEHRAWVTTGCGLLAVTGRIRACKQARLQFETNVGMCAQSELPTHAKARPAVVAELPDRSGQRSLAYLPSSEDLQPTAIESVLRRQ